MKGIFNLLKDNKEKVFKMALGLAGTAVGLMVASAFTTEDEEIDPDSFVVTEDAEVETVIEEPTETVEV